MSYIFLSYSHDDGEYVRRLAVSLEEKGFEVWIDERIDYGTRWPHVIQEHLDGCSAFIVVMTPRSYQSDWVQNELSRAKRKRKPVFPLLWEGDAWLSVEATQYIDVTDGKLPPVRFYERLAGFVSVRIVIPPRPLFEPEMVLIPAGEFLMGSDPKRDKDAQDNEQPQHTLYLPEYYLAKTPLTNSQYATFVAATNCKPPAHWEGGKVPIGKKDHPVVNVSWLNAIAYCEWLSKATSKPYRLPSEAEWEKGARSTDGRLYPWGDQWNASRCNTSEGGKGDTTPVGAYLDDASPYGLLDMAGNVWEWTCSLWGTDWDEPDYGYPYNPEDGRENLDAPNEIRRVVRGGSWLDDQRGARCASRNGDVADDFNTIIGFRVVVSLSS